jgi:hypothetical protein
MFNHDPDLILSLHHQRSQRLREEAAADALADRLRERVKSSGWWRLRRGHHRRRAPVIP